MSKRNGTMPDYLSCPFCHETDFDRIGLKHHFQSGHCDAWNETPPPPSLRPTSPFGLPANARVIATRDLSTSAQETPPARPCVWRTGCRHPSVCDEQNVCVPGGKEAPCPHTHVNTDSRGDLWCAECGQQVFDR